jgi:hypothetical protein
VVQMCLTIAADLTECLGTEYEWRIVHGWILILVAVKVILPHSRHSVTSLILRPMPNTAGNNQYGVKSCKLLLPCLVNESFTDKSHRSIR